MIGLVGKPNAGKSTFFSAATHSDVEIANYPFTTIGSNKGIAYIRDKCPHTELGVKCDPGNSACIEGTRFVPIEIIDVAGLVPDAYKGKGLGNEFLDQLRQASSLIHVIDSSGKTNLEGEPLEKGEHNPKKDVEFLEKEIQMWIYGMLEKKWGSMKRNIEADRQNTTDALTDALTGVGVKKPDINKAIKQIQKNPEKWKKTQLKKFSKEIVEITKPTMLSLNKADVADQADIKKLEEIDKLSVPTSAQAELVLKNMDKKEIIDYVPGEDDFQIKKPKKLNKKQKKGLKRIKTKILDKYGSTGVQECLEKSIRELLNKIVVYPVENENNYTNKQGEVLPDAYLLKKGSTPEDLAYKVHSDIGNNFLHAINAKTGMRISNDHQLENGDIIKIITSN
ncbi:redox-regulated ATPase YchF [archaeon SCG-AAA382B04]|nr:redox-regulated ATPase YchF [archaeon SCG-AAA382B04]